MKTVGNLIEILMLATKVGLHTQWGNLPDYKLGSTIEKAELKLHLKREIYAFMLTRVRSMGGAKGGQWTTASCALVFTPPPVTARWNVGFGIVPSGRHFIHSQRFPLPLCALALAPTSQLQIPGAAHGEKWTFWQFYLTISQHDRNLNKPRYLYYWSRREQVLVIPIPAASAPSANMLSRWLGWQ